MCVGVLGFSMVPFPVGLKIPQDGIFAYYGGARTNRMKKLCYSYNQWIKFQVTADDSVLESAYTRAVG